MASLKTVLYYGALLHDIGKIMYREACADEAHFQLGANFIANDIASQNNCFVSDDGKKITEQIRCCSKDELSLAGLPNDSLAYITWFANTISSQSDGSRVEEAGKEDVSARATKMRRIFNRLNGHHDDYTVEHKDYTAIKEALREGLVGMDISSSGVASLLSLLESTLDTVPAQIDEAGLVDVSLYDHMKTTACIAACVYEYLQERGTSDYRGALFDGGGTARARGDEMFLLYACDMSGIQDFIYTISGDGALKQLRARSMYLELLLEHIVDELLEKLGLSRANLLYAGGGHAYLLLPNTEGALETLRAFDDELRDWFVDQYRNDLYLASAWVACSADDLANRGKDKRRYPMLFYQLKQDLSEAKASRYDAATIRRLNFDAKARFDHSWECSECHRSDVSMEVGKDEENRCGLCAALGEISKHLVQKDVFVVERSDTQHAEGHRYATLALPFGCHLSMLTLEEYRSRRLTPQRVYIKGERVKGGWRMADGHAVRIWMGDYTADTPPEVGISAYASQSARPEAEHGIQRLGVLRADVDDLGAAFTDGLPDDRMFIGRSSALSRALGFFFKSRINDILQQGGYQVQIIYSGGDDLFMIGNWNDVIYAAIDIQAALYDYTGNGSLTLSGGIGMFGPTYPIARMASEVGELEDAAKHYESSDRQATKNAVALWSEEAVFGWKEFTEVVVKRKDEVHEMFEQNQKGNAFVYRLIALLRDYDSAASAPRLAYLLARSFEDDHRHGRERCNQIYAWAQNPQERRRLITALEWYMYSVRKDIAHE